MQTVPHQQSPNRHPLAQLVFAFSIGILAQHFLSIPLAIALSVCALLSAMVFIALLRLRTTLATAFLLLAVLSAGALLSAIGNGNRLPKPLERMLDNGIVAAGDPIELTGVIQGAPEYARGRLYFTLNVEGVSLAGVDSAASGVVALMAPFPTLTVEKEFRELELRYGARIRVMTTLRRTDNYRNPGVPLFTEFLERRGYDATGLIKSPLLIERLDDVRVFLPLAWLYRWREQLQKQIDLSFSPSTAGVLDAALLGNRYNLTPQTAERFRAGGTFHVLVISGLHISFIGGVVFLLARRLTKKKAWQFVLSTTVLWCYSIAVGAEPSVVRAALMFTIVTLGPVIFRRVSSLNALGGAALLLLVVRPQDLFDPSFQLTFVSVLAIVAIAWPLLRGMAAIGSWHPTRETPYPPTCSSWLRNLAECLFWSERQWQKEIARGTCHYKTFKTPMATRLKRWHLQRCARYGFGAVVVSVSVQLLLLPLLIIYFHRLSLASVVLNIGVSLLMAALAVESLMALLLAQISPAVATALFSIANALNWLMVHSVDPFSRFGIASLRVAEYSGPTACTYALYYLPLTCLAVSLNRWNPVAPAPVGRKSNERRITIVVAVHLSLLGLLVLHPFSSPRPDGRLHVDFLDVGQGDSALVTMPDGATLLIDGGGRPNFSAPAMDSGPATEEEILGHETRSIGEAVVSEYLWWRGLDHLDYILATHADADHIDGLNDVARNFSVRATLVARTPRRDPEYQKFAETLQAQGVPVFVIGSGDVLSFGAVRALVLWPPSIENPDAPSRNNDSIVLRLKFGERTFLLTGDIEGGAERALLDSKEDLGADVVKVAHHGSKTSSTEKFIAATRPRFAIISVGQTSVFGHPNPDVVERWTAGGSEVLTTGRSGTITFTTDGSDLQITKFVR